MRFSVPQYITIEDKLLGLITFKQLFLLLGAFLVSYGSYKLLPVFFALIITAGSFAIAALFGFVTINGRSLFSVLPQVLGFFTQSKKYLWRAATPTQTKSLEVSIINKYFSPADSAYAEEFVFAKKTPEQASRPTEIIHKVGSSIQVERGAPKPPPIEKPTVEATNFQPLMTYIKQSHAHLPNPSNPYRYFPLPKLPKKQW